MRTLCKHIFASAERKFNTVISSLGDTLHLCKSVLRISSEEMLIKKIRLLEFYVFGNVTVSYIADAISILRFVSAIIDYVLGTECIVF